MAALDVLIILLFIAAVAYGLYKGFIAQFGSVGGVLVGIVACRLFSDPLARLLAGGHPDANDAYVSGVFACVILFIVGYFAARLVAGLVKTVSRALHLTLFDRVGGVVFSLFEWFLVFSLLLNIWQAFRPDISVVAGSRLAGGRAAAAVIDFAPKVLGSETFKDFVSAVAGIGAKDSADKQ
ncbi:MAG: CvpA family protein [Muribaculaceae bacterium]|nr:CvpA family protein [Muribaculaceae bacterium]